MELSLRKKALEKLAQQNNAKVLQALLSEHQKIADRISVENEYHSLSDQLDLLDCFAYRVHSEAIKTISDFLKRLEDIKLQHQTVPGISQKWLDRHYSASSLTIKALDVLKNIQYVDMDAIFPIFLEYSVHTNEDIRTYTEKLLKDFAEYHLELFYDKDGHRRYGAEPQVRILNLIQGLSHEDKERFRSGLIILCSAMLSPSMEGTSSNYKTFTITTAAVPADTQVKQVRSGALDMLESMYDEPKLKDIKEDIRHAMLEATLTHSRSPVSDATLDMIAENTTRVLDFLLHRLPDEPLLTRQKIEQLAWSLNYHREHDVVRDSALKIKDALDQDEEYQIFKILVGFEGVFGEWLSSKEEDEQGHKPSRYERSDKIRNEKCIAFAESIDEANYAAWERRIVEYGSIESNDMAMFPYFGKFLEHFGRTSPELGLRLLASHPDVMMRHGSLARGIWESGKRQELKERMLAWVAGDEYLPQIIWWLTQVKPLEEDLLRACFTKTTQEKDKDNLTLIAEAVTVHYGNDTRHLIDEIFLPAVQALTDLQDATWSLGFWWREDRKELIASLDDHGVDIILDNMIWLDAVDHQAETALVPIAERFPDKIIHFFGERLQREKDKERDDRYDAIPYSFDTLQEPLSKAPDTVVDIVSSWYDGNYGMFGLRGARLLHNIFPAFPAPFEAKLLSMVTAGDEDQLEIVLAVLRKYEGRPCIHNVCKAIIKALPPDNTLLNEVEIALIEEGMVTGEFGFVEAKKAKKEQILPWLDDDDEKVRQFAQKHIEHLDADIIRKQQRAEESLELQKFQYGDADD